MAPVPPVFWWLRQMAPVRGNMVGSDPHRLNFEVWGRCGLGPLRVGKLFAGFSVRVTAFPCVGGVLAGIN